MHSMLNLLRDDSQSNHLKPSSGSRKLGLQLATTTNKQLWRHMLNYGLLSAQLNI